MGFGIGGLWGRGRGWGGHSRDGGKDGRICGEMELRGCCGGRRIGWAFLS